MKRKLKVTDPRFFQKIGKLGGDARKAAGTDFSALAAASHPRAEYCGGRPKGSKNKKKAKKKEK
jgi:hypothetical protein